jgi:hypothetical protein
MTTSSPIVLASGQLSCTDSLSVELIRPSDLPAVIMIRWPGQPTITDPRKFGEAASAAMRVLASATTKLAALRASEL